MGSGWGVRVGVNEEFKFFKKFTKKKFGVRWGFWLVGVRMDVNAMLGVGGDVGYGDVNQE